MSARLPLWVVECGVLPYGDAVSLQEEVHRRRLAGAAPDVLLLLQHPPVITLGRSARAENLLGAPGLLAERGIELHEAARGGDVTYHGPGQLVGYPIISLDDLGRDVHRYVRLLEEALMRFLAGYELIGERVAGRTGVWVGAEKVAAIGVGVRRWISWHGFALNCSTDLEQFRWIVPCGISDAGVTSMSKLLQRSFEPGEAAESLPGILADVFGREALRMELPELMRRTAPAS